MTHSMGSPAQTVPGLQASSKRWMVVGLLAIFALGLGLRLRLLAPGYWVNPDEGIYLQIATSPDEEFVAHAILTNAHPPLYYHLLRSLAHYDARFESLRVSSLIAGGLAMVALAGLGCVVAGRNGMVLSALAGATAPGLLVQSCVLRPYALQVLALTIALGAAVRFFEARGARALVCLSASLTLALWLQYHSLLIAGAIILTALVAFCARRLARGDLLRLALALLPVALSMIALYLLHVRPRLLGSGLQQEAQMGWLRLNFPDSLFKALAKLWAAARFLNGSVAHAPLLILMCVAWGAAFKTRMKYATGLASCAMLLAIAFARLGLLPLGASRHSTYLLPVFTMLAAAGLTVLLRWAREGPRLPPARSHAVRAGGRILLILMASMLAIRCGVCALRGNYDAIGDNNLELVVQAEPARAVIRALADSPRAVWIADQQTHYLLMPAIPAAERRTVPLPDGSGLLLEWGGRRLYVLPVWAMPDVKQAETDPLERLLAAHGAQLVSTDGRVGLVLGGWGESVVWRMARDMGQNDGALDIVGDAHLAFGAVRLADVRAWRSRRAPPHPSHDSSLARQARLSPLLDAAIRSLGALLPRRNCAQRVPRPRARPGLAGLTKPRAGKRICGT